jgi:hypothetical protein
MKSEHKALALTLGLLIISVPWLGPGIVILGSGACVMLLPGGEEDEEVQ